MTASGLSDTLLHSRPMSYYPDYPPGVDTPHGILFDQLMKAGTISAAAVVDAILDCETVLAKLPDRQIAYELMRLHQMLGRFGGAFAAEDLMYGFCDRPVVSRDLRASFGRVNPELAKRLKQEEKRPGRYRRWAGVSRR